MLSFPSPIEVCTAEECRRLGYEIALRAQLNDVIALCGPIGIGKTTLTQGIVAGLGVDEAVQSQTFTIIKSYDNTIPIYHVDLYRIRKIDMQELGLEQLCASNTIVIVEWADRMVTYLPPNTTWIRFALQPSGARMIYVTGTQ